jgi:hypothetical protein
MNRESAAEKLFSFFTPPVTTVVPSREITLAEVNHILVSDELKSQTEEVRVKAYLKVMILPFVTFSCICTRRRFTGIEVYTGFIIIDWDNCDISLKSILAADKFLKPVLVFTSPRGTGLKLLIYIVNGTLQNHLYHFNAIAFYLSETYDINIDKSGSDPVRCCFLCEDKEAIYQPGNFVTSESLLNYLPPEKTTPFNVNATSVPVFETSTTTTGERPSDLLNKMPAVYQRALNDLVEIDGWTLHNDGIHLTREGKEKGISAIFNYYPEYGFPVFTNFSSSAKTFTTKGFAPVQIICHLEFDNDWNRCIAELAAQYLD